MASTARGARPRAALAPLAMAAMAAAAEPKTAAEHAEHGELDDVTWASALLMISAVVVGIGVLYMVHWQDENMRKEAWALVNTTISIFCAAGIDFGLCRLITTLFLPEDQWEEPEKSRLFFCLIFLLACLAPVILHSCILRIHEEEHQRLFAASTLGSHIVAFLAILSFGSLQQVETQWQEVETMWVWLLPLIAFLFMRMVYGLLRGCNHRNERKMQGHQFEHAMVEACSILVSFLLVQCLCYAMSAEIHKWPDAEEHEKQFMPVMGGPPHRHTAWCVPVLVLVAVLSMVLSFLRSWCCQHLHGFCGKCMAEALPVTAAWCIQRAGVILLFALTEGRMRYYLKTHICKDNGHSCPETAEMSAVQGASRTQIVNAVVMSILAVTGLWLTDKVADFLEGKFRHDDTVTGSSSDSESEWDLDGVAHSLRSWVTGFGVLVGISWEKAFDTAYETVLNDRLVTYVAEESDFVSWLASNHPKLARGSIAFISILLSFFVLPAWYCYIVPNAMKEEHAHAEELRCEDGHRPRLPQARTPTELLSDSDKVSD